MVLENKNFKLNDGIYDYTITDPVTSKVKEFYQEDPFPNYRIDDNKHTISLSSSANFIQTSRGLEIQIPEAFNIGTVKMNQYSAKILNDIAEYLKENPYKIVLIESHTDSYPVLGFGSFVYPDNWKLSVARANEISDYLLFQGIQPEKMMALGFADRWPFGNSWEDVYSGEITDSIIDSMNVTVNQRTKNRRINIVITNTEKEYGEANKTIYYEQKCIYTEISATPSDVHVLCTKMY